MALLNDGKYGHHALGNELGLSLLRSPVYPDPHTATGTLTARRLAGPYPVVTMATAHPAKFPDAVERATGIRPALPDHLADLFDRPERTETIPNDLAAVEDYVARVSRVGDVPSEYLGCIRVLDAGQALTPYSDGTPYSDPGRGAVSGRRAGGDLLGRRLRGWWHRIVRPTAISRVRRDRVALVVLPGSGCGTGTRRWSRRGRPWCRRRR